MSVSSTSRHLTGWPRLAAWLPARRCFLAAGPSLLPAPTWPRTWPSGPAGLTRRPLRHRLAGGGPPADRAFDPRAYLSRGMKIGAAGEAPPSQGG